MTDVGIRVTRRRGYTVVFNDLLPGDGSLSARSWGLYVYLAGRPDGWETRTSQLQKVFREGRDAIYTALGELVDAGLMCREEHFEEGSGLRRTRYALNDEFEAHSRRSAPETGFQDAGSPDTGSPTPGNPGQVTTDSIRLDEANSSLRSEGDEPETEAKPKPKSRAKPKAPQTPFPDDFVVTDEMKAWFDRQPWSKNVSSPGLETQNWADHHRSKGSRFVDWVAAWMLWMRNAGTKYSGGPARGQQPHHPAVDDAHSASVAGLF